MNYSRQWVSYDKILVSGRCNLKSYIKKKQNTRLKIRLRMKVERDFRNTQGLQNIPEVKLLLLNSYLQELRGTELLSMYPIETQMQIIQAYRHRAMQSHHHATDYWSQEMQVQCFTIFFFSAQGEIIFILMCLFLDVYNLWCVTKKSPFVLRLWIRFLKKYVCGEKIRFWKD